MVEEQDGETTFSPTNSSKYYLNDEQLTQNNFRILAKDTRHPERPFIKTIDLQWPGVLLGGYKNNQILKLKGKYIPGKRHYFGSQQLQKRLGREEAELLSPE